MVFRWYILFYRRRFFNFGRKLKVFISCVRIGCLFCLVYRAFLLFFNTIILCNPVFPRGSWKMLQRHVGKTQESRRMYFRASEKSSYYPGNAMAEFKQGDLRGTCAKKKYMFLEHPPKENMLLFESKVTVFSENLLYFYTLR